MDDSQHWRIERVALADVDAVVAVLKANEPAAIAVFGRPVTEGNLWSTVPSPFDGV